MEPLVSSSKSNKLILSDRSFSRPIYSNTVKLLTLKFNQQKSQREGSMAFHDRIKPSNSARSPWASCNVFAQLASISKSSTKLADEIYKVRPMFFMKGVSDSSLFHASLLSHISRPFAAKLEQMRKEFNLGFNYRANSDPLRIMICVRSDECGELIRSYLIRSLGIESIFLHSKLTECDKMAKVHEFNFSLATCALILNTRLGSLPLPPTNIEKVAV